MLQLRGAVVGKAVKQAVTVAHTPICRPCGKLSKGTIDISYFASRGCHVPVIFLSFAVWKFGSRPRPSRPSQP